MAAKATCPSCGQATAGVRARWCGHCGASLDATPGRQPEWRRRLLPLTALVVAGLLLARAAVVTDTSPLTRDTLDVEVVDDDTPALVDAPAQVWVNPCRIGRDRPCGVPLVTDLPRDAHVWAPPGGHVLVLEYNGDLTLHRGLEDIGWSVVGLLPAASDPPLLVTGDDRLVLAAGNRVVRLNPGDGRVVWRTSAPAEACFGCEPPDIREVVASRGNTLTLAGKAWGAVLDAATGEFRWRRHFSGAQVVATPEGVVVVAEQQASLFGLLQGAEPVWSTPLPAPGPQWHDEPDGDPLLDVRGPTPVPSQGGPISLGEWNLTVLDPDTGDILLGYEEHVEATLTAPDGLLASFLPDEALDGSRVIAAIERDGTQRWREPLGDICCPTRLRWTPEGSVLVSTWHLGGQPARILDPHTGTAVGSLAPPLEATVGSPQMAIAGLTPDVVVWQISYRLIGVDRQSGNQVWRIVGDAGSPATLLAEDPLIVLAQQQVVRIDSVRP